MSGAAMASIGAVIRREYLQRVRSKWFVFATIAGPLLMGGLIFVPAYLEARRETTDRDLVVTDATERLADRVVPRLEDAGYTVRLEPWSEGAVEQFSQQAIDGDFAGVLRLDDETLRTGRASLFTTARPSSIRRLMMQSLIAHSVLEAALEVDGVDANALLAGGDLRVEVLGEDQDSEGPDMAAGFLGSLMLYMVILLWAVAVMRATLEEKTSRIAEIIVSAMKPTYLMLGKIIGVGAVGLTQMFVWAVSLAILLVFALPVVVAARPELAALESVPRMLPGPGGLTLFLGYFLFGYFIFSGMYAAVGAMCNSEEEAQQAQIPVIFLIITPVMFLSVVIEDPTSTLSVGLSLFPFFSPILMWPRVVASAAPVWQIVASFVLMLGAVFAVAWLAGRIYKVGMLMTGKRPTLPELMRWVREA
jgi:ABC-2 type transport system permease protein